MSLRLLKKQLSKQVNEGVEAKEALAQTEKDCVYAYVSQSVAEEEREKKKLVGKTKGNKKTKTKKKKSGAHRQPRVSRKAIIASNLSYLKRMG